MKMDGKTWIRWGLAAVIAAILLIIVNAVNGWIDGNISEGLAVAASALFAVGFLMYAAKVHTGSESFLEGIVGGGIIIAIVAVIKYFAPSFSLGVNFETNGLLALALTFGTVFLSIGLARKVVK